MGEARGRKEEGRVVKKREGEEAEGVRGLVGEENERASCSFICLGQCSQKQTELEPEELNPVLSSTAMQKLYSH